MYDTKFESSSSTTVPSYAGGTYLTAAAAAAAGHSLLGKAPHLFFVSDHPQPASMHISHVVYLSNLPA